MDVSLQTVLLNELQGLGYNVSEVREQMAEIGASANFSALSKLSQGAVGAELWCAVLRGEQEISASNAAVPTLFVALGMMRGSPYEAQIALGNARGMRGYMALSNSIANAAFRTANQLFDDARGELATAEVDTAIGRLKMALAEFRFAIESGLLSDKSLKIASGKYATAAAIVGRWISLPPVTLDRSLRYSAESIQLGNRDPSAFQYRLELLLHAFDASGDVSYLVEARQLSKVERYLTEGSQIAHAEVCLRLAVIHDGSDSDLYLRLAEKYLTSETENGTNAARQTVLRVLVRRIREYPSVIHATHLGIPSGLTSYAKAYPTASMRKLIRECVDELDALQDSNASVPAAILATRLLRHVVDDPGSEYGDDLLIKYVRLATYLGERAGFDRHVKWEAGAAALIAARRTGDIRYIQEARHWFHTLAERYPDWPLPVIGLARVAEVESGPTRTMSPEEYWRKSAELAMAADGYSRSELGGRNKVYAVDDARGFLSETFVFKPMFRSQAVHEMEMLRVLAEAVNCRGLTARFEIPRSLAILSDLRVADEGPAQCTHVIQRREGRLLSAPGVATGTVIADAIELLAIFHSVAGSVPNQSAWKALKDPLKMWSRSLFARDVADKFVEEMRRLLPANLPLVRKRDAHADNWLVDAAGRVAAIDLESTGFLPLGHDLVQLLEDVPLVEISAAGWALRMAYFSNYCAHAGVEFCEGDSIAIFSWFALYRALRLGTDVGAAKPRRLHARQLASLVVSNGASVLKPLALQLGAGLAHIDSLESDESRPSHEHRRLSKSLAYMLRHHGRESGLGIDRQGFADMNELATLVGSTPEAISSVTRHQLEPRFEVRGDRIRALYGHSIQVDLGHSNADRRPHSLYHGSSWAALNSIASRGLDARSRLDVHLSNDLVDALVVGQRHGHPVVLGVDPLTSDLKQASEGIWMTPSVRPDELVVVNPYFADATQYL